MPERKALYPGSFDPPTNGHKWVMEQVAEDFDAGIVAIGYNPEKAGRFPVSERELLLKEIAEEYPNLVISSFFGLYQADFAEMMGAKTIARGIRAADYTFENDIRQVNQAINPNVKTVFYTPPNELQQVSSSMVMGLVGFEGWESEVQRMVPQNVFDRIQYRQEKIDKATLEQKWKGLYERLGAEGKSEVVFYDLFTRYNEPQRAYHTFDHLKTCLNELELVRAQAEQPDLVELALWFHDSVYEGSIPPGPEKPDVIDDEGKSAELARSVIKEDMELGDAIATRVADLILVTKHPGKPKNKDEAILHDIDLAILGRSSRLFDNYEEQIRQEYSWVDEELFRSRRPEILKTFLPPQREYVYFTKFFRERYEEKAKENLERSIQKLTNH